MRHKIPDIYEVLTHSSFRSAIHGMEMKAEKQALEKQNLQIPSEAHVVWKSDCLMLNFDSSYMKICTNGHIIYVGEISKENKAAWEEFLDNYEFSE